jgi:hypothetical protein
LWGRVKKQKILFGIFLFFVITGFSQPACFTDSLRHKRKQNFKQEIDYSLSFSDFLYSGWHHDKSANNIIFLQNLNYKFSVSSGKLLTLSGSFLHNLGVQSYPDSLTKFQTDDNTLNIRLDMLLHKTFNISLISTLVTRLMDGYDYSTDSCHRIVRTLNSSFCTPLIWTLSGGAAVKWKNLGSLTIGVTSAKLTYISDKSIYDKQKVTRFYGVPSDKNHRLEFGLSLQFLADKEILKKLHWTCDLLIFKNFTAPIDFTLRNNFILRISKYLKAGFQTRLLYEYEVCKNIQVENLFTFGFNIHR